MIEREDLLLAVIRWNIRRATFKIFLICRSWIFYSWRRSASTDGECEQQAHFTRHIFLCFTARTRCRAPRTCWVQIIEYTTIGLRLSGHGAAEAHLTEELRHAESSPTCKSHESYCTSHSKFETKILRSDIFAQVNLVSVAPTLQNLRIGLRRKQSGKSKVPAKQRGSWTKVC